MSRKVFTFSGEDAAKIIDALIDETLSEVEKSYNEYARSATRVAENAANNTDACPMCCAAKQSEMINPKLFDCIDRVIAQDSATIILWKDGTKTAVKCKDDEPYDYEKGLAIAVLKKVFGNSVYQNDMKKLMAKYPHVKNPAKKKTAKKKSSKAAKPTNIE